MEAGEALEDEPEPLAMAETATSLEEYWSAIFDSWSLVTVGVFEVLVLPDESEDEEPDEPDPESPSDDVVLGPRDSSTVTVDLALSLVPGSMPLTPMKTPFFSFEYCCSMVVSNPASCRRCAASSAVMPSPPETVHNV